MTAADVFLLTGLNGWQWAGLALATAVVGLSAIWMHRRDRRRN